MNKPIFYPVQYQGDGSLMYHSVVCPHCEKEINRYAGVYEFEPEDKCKHCGQRIDWSEEK